MESFDYEAVFSSDGRVNVYNNRGRMQFSTDAANSEVFRRVIPPGSLLKLSRNFLPWGYKIVKVERGFEIPSLLDIPPDFSGERTKFGLFDRERLRF